MRVSFDLCPGALGDGSDRVRLNCHIEPCKRALPALKRKAAADTELGLNEVQSVQPV